MPALQGVQEVEFAASLKKPGGHSLQSFKLKLKYEPASQGEHWADPMLLTVWEGHSLHALTLVLPALGLKKLVEQLVQKDAPLISLYLPGAQMLQEEEPDKL